MQLFFPVRSPFFGLKKAGLSRMISHALANELSIAFVEAIDTHTAGVRTIICSLNEISARNHTRY